MDFYTNVLPFGDNLLITGYENGERVRKKVNYKPYMFMPSDSGDYRSIEGVKLNKIDFDGIKEAREFCKRYKDVHGFEIYGMDKFQYVYINDQWRNAIEFDYSLLSIVSLDIEVDCIKGYSSSAEAEKEVTLITLARNGKRITFGCQPFDNPDPDNIEYVLCDDEKDLLHRFLNVWSDDEHFQPDIVTGWNIEKYDIPYLVNRISRVLGQKAAKRLSPWAFIRSRTIQTQFGGEETVYDLYGVNVIDYLSAYKKFAFTQQESYTLDHVCSEELDEKKIDYKEAGYDSLGDLQARNWQLYVEYNIRDADLIERLDAKRQLMKLLVTMAFDAKVNFIDSFTTVNLWDVMIHNYLMDNNIAVPQVDVGDRSDSIIGGYVKDPQVGMHDWVISFDLNSLYPHIIMQYNISPETYYGEYPYKSFGHVEDCINSIYNGSLRDKEQRNYLVDNDVCITANMYNFTRQKKGFLPSIMERLYNDRVIYKKKLKEAYKNKQIEPDNPKWDNEIARLDNLQQAKKIQLNSGYGALANIYNRWYRREFAEAITSSGQLTTRWIERQLNHYLNKELDTDTDYVIACDTDSVYLRVAALVDDQFTGDKNNTADVVQWIDTYAVEILQPYIDKCFNQLCAYVNGRAQKMKMKREVIANKAIWTAKKRYMLHVYNDEGVALAEPKMKIQGTEAIRTSTPNISRKMIKETLETIMKADERTMQKKILECEAEFIKQPFDVVAFPRSVSNLTKWKDSSHIYKKGTPIHVKGVLMFNELLKRYNVVNKYEQIAEGQKIKFAYLKTPNPVHVNSIAAPSALPDEFALEEYVDKYKQFEKSYLEPIKTITDAIGWETHERHTLEELF